jgi:hypothetical protein
MGIGTSIFLIAVGAILRFAVADVIEGVALGTVGLILMIAGVIGLLVSLFYASMLRNRGPPRGERTVVREREPY